jgi:hypothetical protein
MRRRTALALLTLSCLAAPLAAQEVIVPAPARVGISPFIGWRVGFASAGDQLLAIGPDTTIYTFEERVGGAPAYGGSLDVRVVGPVGLSAGILYSPSAERLVMIERRGLTTIEETEGSGSLTMGRAGVSIHLAPPRPDVRQYRPWADLLLGGAWIREDPIDLVDFPPAVTQPIRHWGLVFGFQGGLPFGLWDQHLGLQFGAEDYVVFWNEREYDRRNLLILDEGAGGLETVARLSVRPTHVLLLRLGLSLRF